MAYKIKHKESGLFYRPTVSTNSNLSKRGKLYEYKPTDKQLMDWLSSFRDHNMQLPYSYKGFKSKEQILTDFEVVTV
jgi:TorA maturation chaperone TorD